MSQIQRDIDRTLSLVEKNFNIAGYIPLVSSVSGPLRIAYGKLEIIGGIFLAALVVLQELARARQGDPFGKAIKILTTYVLHGLINMFRGAIESVPLLSLVTCLPYDLSGRRITYPYEGPSVISQLRPV